MIGEDEKQHVVRYVNTLQPWASRNTLLVEKLSLFLLQHGSPQTMEDYGEFQKERVKVITGFGCMLSALGQRIRKWGFALD